MIQGSKVISFRRDALARTFDALNDVEKLNCFGHCDLWLSQVMGMGRIHRPKTSMFGVRRHMSVCGSKDGLPVKRKRRVVSP